MQQSYAAFTTETKAVVGCLRATDYFLEAIPKLNFMLQLRH